MILPYCFFILTSTAMWKPVHWKSRWRVILYGFFSLTFVTVFYIDTGSQIIDIVKTSSTVSDYANRSFILLTMIAICIKMISLLRNRQRILALVQRFESGEFEIRNPDEEKIFKEFDQITKIKTAGFSIFAQSVTVNVITRAAIASIPLRMHITKLYLPWDNQTFYGYWIPFVLQLIGRLCCGLVNVAYDSLLAGIMIRIAAQFKILRVRLMEFSTLVITKTGENIEKTEEQKIATLIEHHLDIIQIVSELNDLFGLIILVQYAISSTVLCVTVFVFAEIKHFDSFAAMIAIYTACLYFQIYLLCSSGSEMTSESDLFSTYIYTSNWENMKMKTKKSLLLMMMRSCKPLKFTSLNFIELSLASFSQIVKFSYSAYNVLSQKK